MAKISPWACSVVLGPVETTGASNVSCLSDSVAVGGGVNCDTVGGIQVTEPVFGMDGFTTIGWIGRCYYSTTSQAYVVCCNLGQTFYGYEDSSSYQGSTSSSSYSSSYQASSSSYQPSSSYQGATQPSSSYQASSSSYQPSSSYQGASSSYSYSSGDSSSMGADSSTSSSMYTASSSAYAAPVSYSTMGSETSGFV